MPDEQAVTIIDFQHIPFDNITDTPTTCAGYGITDGGGGQPTDIDGGNASSTFDTTFDGGNANG